MVLPLLLAMLNAIEFFMFFSLGGENQLERRN
jgi:hypothetical protein